MIRKFQIVFVTLSAALIGGAMRVNADSLPLSLDTAWSFELRENRYFFNIPTKAFGKEMLFVSQLVGNAFDFDTFGAGNYLSGFTNRHPPVVFRFEEYDDRVLMRYVRVDVDRQDIEISRAIIDNNVAPVMYSFKIAWRDLAKGIVTIDVSDFLCSPVPWVRLPSKFGMSAADRERSGLISVNVIPNRIDYSQFLTYHATKVPENPTDAITLEIRHSIIPLPVDPMISRFDMIPHRFDVVSSPGTEVFDRKGLDKYIIRWRLEPSDWISVRDRKLVEPLKPILFYVDPSMPTKWRRYVKEGIEDWNTAFEQAGFKDAIRVVQVEDQVANWQMPYMTAVIRYVPGSRIAYARVVPDPRTGEILECTIQLGEDRIELIADRFFVQTAGSNLAVRGSMSDSVKGTLLRGLVSHEVGHALGLMHYMGANRLYSIDSLRSKTFTASNGLSASIMDYTCGNYIAQSGDSVKEYHSRIGEADYSLVVYGYSPIDHVENPADEIGQLREWQKSMECLLITDGASDTGYELGDDALYAAGLGVANLRLVVENLVTWSNVGEVKLQDLYRSVFDQYQMLMESVASKLQCEEKFDVTKDHERISFLSEILFDTPLWLFRSENQYLATSRIAEIQESIIQSLLTRSFASRVLDGRGAQVLSLLSFISNEIYKDVMVEETVDACRRRLQVRFLRILIDVSHDKLFEGFRNTDYCKMAILILQDLRAELENATSRHRDDFTRMHLDALKRMIDDAMN